MKYGLALTTLITLVFFAAFGHAHTPDGPVGPGSDALPSGSTTVLSDLGDDVDSLANVQSLQELANTLPGINEKINAVLNAYPNQSDAIQANARNRLFEYMGDTVTHVGDRLNAFVNPNTTPADLFTILPTTGEIVTNISTIDVFPDRNTIQGGTAISNTVFQGVADDVLGPRGVPQSDIETYLGDPTQTWDFIAADSGALTGLTNLSMPPFGSYQPISTEYTANLPGQVVNMGNPIWQNTRSATGFADTEEEDTVTGLDLIDNIWPGGDRTLTLDPASGNIRVKFKDGSGAGIVVSQLGPVGDFVPQGITSLPDGRRFGMDASVGFVMAPASPDPEALIAYMKAAGSVIYFENNGLWYVKLGTSRYISCGWSWDVKVDNRFSASTVSFTLSGTDPAAKTFAVLAAYGDGTVQKAPPMLRALDALIAMLDKWFPGLFVMDRETGVLDLSLLSMGKYKADWVFESLENNYDAMISAALAKPGSMSAEGLVFEVGDYNQDGKLDLRVYSSNPKGRQVLFSL